MSLLRPKESERKSTQEQNGKGQKKQRKRKGKSNERV